MTNFPSNSSWLRGLKSLALYNLDTFKYMYTIWTKISKDLENIYQ